MPSLEKTRRQDKSAERGREPPEEEQGDVKDVLERLRARFVSARAARRTVGSPPGGPLSRVSAVAG